MLTRPIARRRTRALFDLCAGFIYSQVLVACLRLDLFEILSRGPVGLEALAARLAVPVPAMRNLLEAAVALELLGRRAGGKFGLGPLGAALRGNPAIAAMIDHHAMLYDDLRDPVALVQAPRGQTRLAGYWAYAGAAAPAGLAADRVANYTALMAESQPLVAAEVLAAFDFGRHGCLLDVGGGDGSFLRAVAGRAPGLRLMLFDLPGVVAQAERAFAAAGMAEIATCVEGDFHADPFPVGADIISFVRVLHDHDDAAVLGLLRAARTALPAGGTVLIAEPMAGAHGAGAYFSIYMLAMGRGRARTPDELMELLRQAGFAAPRRLNTPTPLLAQVVTGRRGVGAEERKVRGVAPEPPLGSPDPSGVPAWKTWGQSPWPCLLCFLSLANV